MNLKRTGLYARILKLAAVYNAVWGLLVILFPLSWFELAGMAAPNYPELWQCIGMIVGVYGVAYWFAASDPTRHWPIVLAGLLGKVLGPIGFLNAALAGRLPWKAGWTIVTNDLIWWIPFTMILLDAYRSTLGMRRVASPEIQRMALRVKTQHGISLSELSALSPVMLVFLRHMGCTFCREALADLARQRKSIEANGTRIVLVHMSDPQRAQAILREKGLGDIHHVSDPSRNLYRAFGLDRGNFMQLFGPRVMLRGLLAGIRDGHGLGAVDGDSFQMPGVFVVYRNETIGSYRHQSAADRPDYRKLAAGEVNEAQCIP